MDKFTNSRFNSAPTISKGRSRFDLSHTIRTTCNTGDFVPTEHEEVYPGETFDVRNTNFIRLQTSLHQTMDNAYFETAHFFTPYDKIWDDFDKFLGYNEDPWALAEEVHVPQIRIFGCIVEPQSILNHLGVPAGDYSDLDEDNALEISALPVRAIFEIWNQYFRDENYDTIIAYSKDSNDINASDTFAFNGQQLSLIYYDSASVLLQVNRFHDLFSSVLPAPQKGSPTSLPIGLSAPVFGAGEGLYFTTTDGFDRATGILWHDSEDNDILGNALSSKTLDDLAGSSIQIATPAQAKAVVGVDPKAFAYADLSQATATTVNQLRLAIASQAIKERDARTGTRLVEKIYSIWSVNAPSLELDRPEFLGGKRIPVNMMEVLQTSETGTTVLGTDAGHSKTLGADDGFLKSFVEYGLISSFCYIRTARSYSQGINKKLFKKTIYDFYDPMLDNIGEVDVKEKELNAVGFDSIEDLNDPIGYQEPWYHLKSGIAHDSGYFQAGINGTLDSWHYGDDYEPGASVIPSAYWLKENPNQVDRTIAVSSSIAYQWTIMIYYQCYATRMMSRYNIPNTFGFGNR